MPADDTRDPIDPPTLTNHAAPDEAEPSPDDQTRLTPANAPPSSVFPPRPSTSAIPGYEIIRKLGEGGMGTVYLARDINLNREVALKTLRATDSRPEIVARFWVEAEVMAAVRHPHVVQVFELGKEASRPFIAMEYLSGGPLADRLTDGAKLPPRDAAGLLEKIARGAAAANELGIVHRDLKPANVLMSSGGEPKVADFGLAKRTANDLTRTQALLGTPAYMAPEQAAARAKFVGPAADVWALGVILYKCVAGAKPFEGDTVESLLSQITSAEPTALRTRVRGLPRDLDTIAAKCLPKESERRYSTAAELADDLARFLRGEPIAARPVGFVERAVRRARRKPAAAAAYGFSSLALALAVLVFVIFGLWREAEGAKGEAERAKGDAESARDVAEELRLRAEGLFKEADAARGEAVRLRGVAETALKGEEAAKKQAQRDRERLARFEYGRTIQVADQSWRDNKIAEARALLVGTRADLRGWEYDYVHRLCHADPVTLVGHGDSVHFASFNGNGSRVVTASDDRTARVWDAVTGKMLVELKGHTRALNSASFSADGSKVVTTSYDNTARVWDAASGKTIHELKGHTDGVYAASFSPDGLRILTAGGDKSIRLWDAETGAEMLALPGGETAAFSPDGRGILTIFGNDARIYDPRTVNRDFLKLPLAPPPRPIVH